MKPESLVKLHYKHLGSGPVVLILHGLLGSLDNWQTIARKLAQHYSVYHLDLRNHGRSDHSPHFSLALMAADVLHFMKTHQLHTIYLAGHSMGGKVALEMLNQNAAVIRKCMVLDIAPKAYARGHDAIFRALFSLDLQQMDSRTQADEHLAQMIPQADVRQFLLKNLDRTKHGNFEWKFNLNAIYAHYDEINKPVEFRKVLDSEVLFVKGENSDYIQETDKAGILKQLPKARFEEIRGAGHWIHADRPEELLQLMKSYFQ
jgi:esterase